MAISSIGKITKKDGKTFATNANDLIPGPKVTDQNVMQTIKDRNMPDERDLIGTPNVPVATKDNPVVSVEPETPKYGGVDYSDLTGMNKDQLEDYIDYYDVQRMSKPLTSEEELRLRKASRLLQSQGSVYSENPYDDILKREEQRFMDQSRQIQQRASRAIADKEQAIGARKSQEINRLQKQGADMQDAAQTVLSFSGFGRSTEAARQQAEIQGKVNDAINVALAELDAEQALFEAQQRGAAEETIQGMQQYLDQLRLSRAERQSEIVDQMNEYNRQNAQSYQERVDNILNLSATLEANATPLTEAEYAMAQDYASLVIDSEGNINNKLLESVPAKLLSEVLKQGAILKGAIAPKEEPADAADVVKTDRGTFQWNPETQRYDIPVGGGGNISSGTPQGQNQSFVDGQVPIGTGNVTAYGTEANPFGLDIDGYVGQDLVVPVGGTVVNVGDDPDGFGNYVIIEDETGKKIRYAHMDSVDVEIGQQIGAGSRIGAIGNSGYTIPGAGGDGSHIDITLFDEQGTPLTAQEVEQYLKGGQQPVNLESMSSLAQAVINGSIKESEIKNNIKGTDKTVEDVLAEVQAYRRSILDTEEIDSQTQDLIDKLEELKQAKRRARKNAGRIDAEGSSAVGNFIRGTVGGVLKEFSPGLVDLKTKFDQIINNLAFENLADMKARGATFGALSDTELRKIGDAATNLDLFMSQDGWENEIETIIEKLKDGKKLIGEVDEGDYQLQEQQALDILYSIKK